MTPLQILALLIAVLIGLAIWIFNTFWNPKKIDEMEYIPPEPPKPPSNSPPALLWDTPRHAYHSVRVLCDEAELTVDEKNLICAVVYQESQFHNSAKNENKNANGVVLSTDWGLCQINDHYHIGEGKDFPSVEFVLNNPAEVVSWMISQYRHGNLKMWIGFKSGAFKKWLLPVSPMWLLRF